MKLVIATSNAGKIREMQALLSPALPWQIISLVDFPLFEMPPEDGETMAANARIKAKFCAKKLQLPCLADDSGLEVDALNGEPGVRSARWFPGTDPDRNTALLARLQNVPANKRTARFRCALCLAMSEDDLHEVEATCVGRVALSPSGNNGFGYDPIFEISAATRAKPFLIGQTMAELTSSEKSRLSHRGRAIELLLEELKRMGVK